MKPKNKPRKMRLHRQSNKKRSINRFTIRTCEVKEETELTIVNYFTYIYGYGIWYI